MNPKEFEQHVDNLFQELDTLKLGKHYRNRRFPGVLQPGKYEIDIAVVINLYGVLEIFVIVECKKWKRKVDRPVVQKLIQTRDAISASIAAIASPVGFTKEAIEVANANRIGLWTIEEMKINLINSLQVSIASAIIERSNIDNSWEGLYYSLRRELYKLIGNEQPDWGVQGALHQKFYEENHEPIQVLEKGNSDHENEIRKWQRETIDRIVNTLLKACYPFPQKYFHYYRNSYEKRKEYKYMNRKARQVAIFAVEAVTVGNLEKFYESAHYFPTVFDVNWMNYDYTSNLD